MITLLISLILTVAASLDAQPFIDVVFPIPGQQLRYSDSHYIYGSVSPPSSNLSVNGKQVVVYENGAFIVFLPVEAGPFNFMLSASDQGRTVEKNIPVFIGTLRPFTPDSLALDPASASPIEEVLLAIGDELEVSVNATPGCQVRFSIDGTGRWFTLKPSRTPAGTYSGKIAITAKTSRTKAERGFVGGLRVVDGDSMLNRRIKVQVQNPEGDVISHAFGDVTILPALSTRPVRVLPRMARLEIERGGRGQSLFFPGGTQLFVSGKRGPFWRVQLEERLKAWIHEGDFYLDTEHPDTLKNALGPARVDELAGVTRVRIPMKIKAPFQVEQQKNPGRLSIVFWGKFEDIGDLDPVDSRGIVLQGVWQGSRDGLRLNLKLELRQQWGYFSSFSGDTLELDIRHPPEIQPESPLAGRVIFLDPGHSPDEGAIGPTRVEERIVNWSIAEKLGELLKSNGATVILSRSDEDGASVSARTQMAELIRPDIVLSIHNNSLPEGIDPDRDRGTTTHYYHEHSYRLAETIQRNLTQDIGLPDQGVRFSDLAICRLTGMPSVLVECAFMILPAQEYLLSTREFQDKIARSLLNSLEQYFRKYAV